MTTERKILEYLDSEKYRKVLKHKGLKTGFLGLPDFKHYKYQTLANNCSNLQNKGYIKKGNNGEFFITYKGEDFLKNVSNTLEIFETCNTENMPKTLLVIYDIPQEKKKERDWFRRHLKKFHFAMIQKSVWVGPAPLPKVFVAYVKEIELGENFKTFKLAKGYVSK